jgi:DNA-directed RNA polymerase specialized sigma24 family protein
MAMGEADAGDAAAASVLPLLRATFVEHSDALVRLAGVLTRDQGTAEEVVQEAFVRLYGARLRDPDSALPYLRRIVVNLCH